MAVTDEAILKIKDMIVSGELGPGERLPKENELAATLGLSRSSLREAVRALSLVRILDVRQGDGTYVTSLAPSLLLEAMGFVIDFHQDDSVLYFLEVRRVLEPYAVSLMARSATPDQTHHLRHIIDQASSAQSTEQFMESDRTFHQALGSYCGNPVLTSLIESISGPTYRARTWRAMTEPDALRRTVREHRGIVEAIEAHQADVAAARATVHIAGLEDWLRGALPNAARTRRSSAKGRVRWEPIERGGDT